MIRLAFLLCFLFYITIIHSQRMTQDDIYHELILKMTEVNNNLEVAERNNLEKEDEYYNSLYDEEYDLQSYQHSRIKTHTQNDVYTDNNNVNTRHHSVVEGSAENAEVNKPATDNLKNVEGDMDTTTDDHAPIANQQTSTNIVELTIHQVNGEQTLHKVDITNAGDIKNFVELLRTDTLHELNEIGEELITDTMEYVAGKKDLLMMEQECIYDKMNTAHQLVINRTRESANAGFDMVECSKIMDMDAWRANVDEKMRPYQDCYVNIIMEEYNRIREMNEFKMKITNEVSRTLRNLKLCKNRVHPNDLCIETNGKNNDIINFVEGKTRKMASAFREANAVTHLTMDKMIYTCKFLNVITEFDKPFVEFIWKINSCMKLQTSGAYTPKIHTKVDVDNKVRCSPIFAQEERRSEKIVRSLRNRKA